MKLVSLLVVFAILVAGCAGAPLAQREPTPSPTFTRTPKPTFTPTPSETTPALPPAPISTPVPSPEVTHPAPMPSPSPVSQPETAFQSPLATPTPGPIETPTGQVRAVVIITELNIRSGPGAVYPVVGKAKLNDTFTVLARDARGDWLQLCCIGGKDGWALAQYLRIEGGTIDALSVAQTIPPTPTPRPRPTPTPVPPPPPPSMPYVLTSVKCMGAGSAYLKVFVRAGGQPQGGVNVVFVPVGVCNGPTTPIDGSRGCTLKVDGPLPGNWQVYLTDAAGNRISDYANVKTDSSGCISAEIYFDHR
ncbi:MAG: SH3 domain-containing protein [Anaerolineae bacterium]|nr:SH3 domain-containing protein [Anaerolineae bacterium]MDW8102152.1 SH3 domain-containing protein [Anaerolineae bacterium]